MCQLFITYIKRVKPIFDYYSIIIFLQNILITNLKNLNYHLILLLFQDQIYQSTSKFILSIIYILFLLFPIFIIVFPILHFLRLHFLRRSNFIVILLPIFTTCPILKV
jgi:hypothetical protein